MSSFFFSSSDIGAKLEKVGESGVSFNGKIINIPNGKITGYSWNTSDGSLVLCDEKGNKWFMVGPQRGFIAYKGQNKPYDIEAYKKAVRECSAERDRAEGKNVKNNKEQKNEKKTKFSLWSALWKVFKWIFKGFFSLFLLMGIGEIDKK